MVIWLCVCVLLHEYLAVAPGAPGHRLTGAAEGTEKRAASDEVYYEHGHQYVRCARLHRHDDCGTCLTMLMVWCFWRVS
jgi:hypothetical protein